MKIALTMLPLWVPNTPPLGLASIAAVLRQNGHEVELRDLNHEIWSNFGANADEFWSDENLDLALDPIRFHERIFPSLKPKITEYAQHILKEGFDCLALSINEINLHSTRFLIHLIKGLNPNLPIIIGGPDVHEKNKLLLEDFEKGLINVGIIGEGEESVLDSLKIIQGLVPHDPSGLLTPANVKTKSFKVKRGSIDFSKLPIPHFQDFDIPSYRLKVLPIMMSRGCVAACSYCTEFVTWRSYRIRDAQAVFEELKHHVEVYGIESFLFCDSLINGNPVMLESLVDLILEKELKIKWQAYARADKNLTRELLFKMAKAGCEHLNIGFESGSNKILKLMNKATTVEEGDRVAKDAYDAGIGLRGLFIIGFPGEEEQDFNQTLSFIYRNKKSFSKVFIGTGLQITPISPMGQRPKLFDVKLNPDGSIQRDKEGNWQSRDGSLTIRKRKERLKIAQNFLISLKYNWDPRPTTSLEDNFGDLVGLKLKAGFWHLKFGLLNK